MKKYSQKKIFDLLLSGRHPQAKKYAGHHVMIIENKIIPLKEGKKALKDLDNLEKKYGKTPILVFVPRQDVSYILVICQK